VILAKGYAVKFDVEADLALLLVDWLEPKNKNG
jgi:hypothetical protein